MKAVLKLIKETKFSGLKKLEAANAQLFKVMHASLFALMGSVIFSAPNVHAEILLDEFAINGFDAGFIAANINAQVYETQTLTITTKSSTAEDVTVTLSGDVAMVSVTNGADTSATASEIAAHDYSSVGGGWDAVASTNTVTFTSRSYGAQSGSYSLSGTTAAGTFVQDQAGIDYRYRAHADGAESIIGTERAFTFTNTSVGGSYPITMSCKNCGFLNAFTAAHGAAAPASASQTGSLELIYDSNDHAPGDSDFSVNYTGLSSLDLTQGSTVNVLGLDIANNAVDTTALEIVVYTDENNHSTYTLDPVPNVAGALFFIMSDVEFSAFTETGSSGPADFTDVGAVTITLDHEGAVTTGFDRIVLDSQVTASISAAFADGGDVNGDGDFDPGDTVRYTATITNPDDPFNFTAESVRYDATFSGRGSLQGNATDSVTSKGSFDTDGGDEADDTAIAVTIGDLADGESVTISYNVLLDGTAATEDEVYTHTGYVDIGTEVVNQEAENNIDISAFNFTFELEVDTSGAADSDGDGFYGVGETIPFIGTVTNTGLSSVLDVDIIQLAIPNASLDTSIVSVSQGVIFEGDTSGDTIVSVDLSTIDGGNSATFEFGMTVDADFDFSQFSTLSLQSDLEAENNGFEMMSDDDGEAPPKEDITVVTVDAIPDNIAASIDADGDGLPDEWNEACNEACQTSSGLTLDSFPNDYDNDGQTNDVDTDDDNDGYSDTVEASEGTSPTDETDTPLDTDGDFDPDSTDPDDDNDGYSDTVEESEGTSSIDDSSTPDDIDGDFDPDSTDPDIDGDGVSNGADAFPLDNTETSDNDGDGTGDNADTDDDNDGVADTDDAFPLDENESVDTDGDGVGNNADADDDNDGLSDSLDAFPLDSEEQSDADNDGTGDNADLDDDNDGVNDTEDAFPNDANESSDNDGDGIGDVADTDDDNDGVADTADAFPTDAAASIDTDGDGLPDEFNENCDAACLAASVLEVDPVPTSTNNIIPTSGGGGGGSFGNFFLTMLCLIGVRRKFI